MRDNRAFVVTELGVVILKAEVNVKTKGKISLRYKIMN